MKSNNFKHVYAFVLLFLTFLWSAFSVWVTWQAIKTLNATNIVAAAGCDTLLGSLITYNSLVIQHYFRKAVPEETNSVPIK